MDIAERDTLSNGLPELATEEDGSGDEALSVATEWRSGLLASSFVVCLQV